MRRLMLIALLIGSLFLYGCGEDEVITGPSPYKGGNDGITAEFESMGIEESGINTIFEDETFPIQVVLRNKGEYDVKEGEVEVSIQGIPLSDFSGIPVGILTNDKEIEKISDLNEEGGEVVVDFGQNVKYVQDIPGTFYDINVFASYTYAYETYASVPKVCFKENLRDDRVCTVDESKTVYSSGAPIQVTSALEKPAGAGIIEVDFEVENVGGGKSTLPGQEFSAQYNQLGFIIEPSTEVDKWTCSAAGRENQARLVDGKATIRCRLKEPLADEALYTKAIGLTLSYDYRDIISETVRIKKTI